MSSSSNNNSNNSGGGGIDRGAVNNIILGIPQGGLQPGTPDAEALHQAEVFLSELRSELEEYDRANAKAVESAAAKWGLFSRFRGANQQQPSVASPPPLDANGTAVLRSTASDKATRAWQINRFMFKKRNPHRVPLLLRWWVPWVCVASLGVVWTPDTWKLRGLHYADSQYAAVRRLVHTQYWRMTMNPDEFAALMKEIELSRDKRSVKSTDCPF